MNASREFDSIESLISSSETGFFIFDQCPALGNEFREKDEERSKIRSQLKVRLKEAVSKVRLSFGEPTQAVDGWEFGNPDWATGEGYALWKQKTNFVTVFISWGNPEDPSFVIVAQAPNDLFYNDHTNRQPDPWNEEWMYKGEW